MSRWISAVLLAAIIAFVGLPIAGVAGITPIRVPGKPAKKEVAVMTFTISSPSFAHGGEIPSKHTCEGADISPALVWEHAPTGTKSLALIVDDPDAPDPKAPKMTWVHWVLYNLPPGAHGLTEGIATKNLPVGTLEGTTDYKRGTWGGPCPPIGRHRYYFKLYALDVVLPDRESPNKIRLLQAMEGHILAQAELMGTYEKKVK